MKYCNATECYFGFETVTNEEAGNLYGGFRSFIEAMSFILFASGVVLNTGILTLLISIYPNIDTFDAYMMNLSFGELMASFGLSFMLFVELTASIAPMGDTGCRFITWLDLTSVTITITTLIALFFEMYKMVYNNSRPRSMKRHKLWASILMLWVIASVPGLPYMATAKMENGFCQIENWSRDAEVLFICAMIFFQIIIPVAMLMFFFVRTLLALRVSLIGGTILRDDGSNPGSEATFQRGIKKRKFQLITSIALAFYLILITFSIMELALILNLNNIEASFTKHARIRELASLILCFKTVVTPLFYLCFYDKLRMKFTRICLCRRDPDVYNTLRYNVYQQTVSEGNAAAGNEEDEEEMAMANEEFAETERDDVAILS